MFNVNAILIPLDGSDVAECALAAGITVARRLNAFIHLVRVHTQLPHEVGAEVVTLTPETEREVVAQEEEYLDRIADRLRDEGLAVSTDVVKGAIVPALRAYSDRHGIGLVVMSSHGRGGLSRAVLGSVADDLIRSTLVPVLIVTPRTAARITAGWPGRILVPLDGSELGASAMNLLPVLDPAHGASVLLVSVLQTVPAGINPWVFPPELLVPTIEQRGQELRQYLDRAARRLRSEGFRTGIRVATGCKVAAEILKLAIGKGSDLIVMSTHGAGGIDRVMFGSVADQVLRHANIPVLVVRAVVSQQTVASSAVPREWAKVSA